MQRGRCGRSGHGARTTSLGLRASLALHRLAERVEANHVAAARDKGWSWQQIEDAFGRHPPIRAHQIQEGVFMTTESVMPEVLHPWAIYLRASEEARRRGDRRTGTDHVLLALLEDPSIEVVSGVSLQQAREALESLDREALAVVGLGSGIDAAPLPMRAVPKKPRIRDVMRKDRLRPTPAAKKVLQEAVKPNRRKGQVTAQQPRPADCSFPRARRRSIPCRQQEARLPGSRAYSRHRDGGGEL